MIVYFARKSIGVRNFCVFSLFTKDDDPKHLLKGHGCYQCPARSCVEYPDGYTRIECGESTAEAISRDPRFEVVKIIKQEF